MSPALIMQGGALEVALSFTTALFGVFLVSVAVTGFFFTPIVPGFRIVYVAAGLALIVPIDAFVGAPWINLAGGALGAALIAANVVKRRARETLPATAGE